MGNSTPIWSDRKRIFCGLPWTFTTYTLTSDRLFIETGVLGKHEDEVRLYRILDISLSRSFSQRIFGLGTIHCCSAKTDQIHNLLLMLLRKSRPCGSSLPVSEK